MKTSVKESLVKRLKAIKPHVTASDRKAAENALGVHYSTIHNYLHGQVAKPDFGIKLLKFFESRIEDRKNVLV